MSSAPAYCPTDPTTWPFFRHDDWPGRLRGTAVLAGAALVLFLIGQGFADAGNTLRTLCRVQAALALLGGTLLAMSSPWRRRAVSVLLVYHLLGVVVAMTSASPGGGRPSWVANKLYVNVYKPYLQFFYQVESYRFFAPNPGPPVQLWFHIEYANGGGRWVKMPSRDEAWTALDHHRQVKLTEMCGQVRTTPDELFPELTQLYEERVKAGQADHIPLVGATPERWYQEPTPFARHWLSSYVRHVAHVHAQNGDLKTIKAIRVYKVSARLVTPDELARGLHPQDETLSQAWYMGEYDTRGELTPECYRLAFNAQGQVIRSQCHRDPYLYWFIPIVRVEPADEVSPALEAAAGGVFGVQEIEFAAPAYQPFPLPGQATSVRKPPVTGPVQNYVRRHAGDRHEVHPGW